MLVAFPLHFFYLFFISHPFPKTMFNTLPQRATKRLNKVLGTGLLVLGSASAALAQGGLNAGKQGIQDATTAITGYFDPATLLLSLIHI